MFTQTDIPVFMYSPIVVSQVAEDLLLWGRRNHWYFRIIVDFQGVIEIPVISSKENFVYAPKRDEDNLIIPKAALRRHAAVEKAGYKVAQVIIGHELKVSPEEPITLSPTVSDFDRRKTRLALEISSGSLATKPKIDWGNVAEVAGKGLLVGMMGIAMISIYALAGIFQLVDPSYCVVLDDGIGTVVELLRWSTEA